MKQKIKHIPFLLLILLFLSSTVSAVDFSFTDTEGESHTLSQYKGKWVLVNFWATWCPPCRREMPDFIEVYKQYKDKDFIVIGV
ncbi:MAG: TlpA family protein disulfide reductase, partial [Gammaproteobacteria bacterium]